MRESESGSLLESIWYILSSWFDQTKLMYIFQFGLQIRFDSVRFMARSGSYSVRFGGSGSTVLGTVSQSYWTRNLRVFDMF